MFREILSVWVIHVEDLTDWLTEYPLMLRLTCLGKSVCSVLLGRPIDD